MSRIAALALAVAVVAPLPTPGGAGGLQCYNDWAEAAEIVEREELATVEELWELARGRLPGVIVKTTLCLEEEAYTYRLVVRAKGRLHNFTVDARHPFDQ